MAANVARNLNTHYGKLAQSTQRLSTGLRVNSAADDAAGLAIRELQRADVAALHQGARNANDAVSMIQTADGALAIIDEKLIRMKELAEQAATGTYDSTQRLMIDSEYQAMAAEINRIANATDFNGIHLLNGNLSGAHNGSGLNSTGAIKIHFGSGNDSAEDYYYVSIGDCTIAGLGLGNDEVVTKTVTVEKTIIEKISSGEVESITSKISETKENFHSGIVSFAYIPSGAKDMTLNLDDHGANDSIEIFTRSGKHLVGTKLGGSEWDPKNPFYHSIQSADDANKNVLTTKNGFDDDATYDDSELNGITGGGNLPYVGSPPYNSFTINGMHFTYSGDGNAKDSKPKNQKEYFHVDEATEDLIVLCVGAGMFDLSGTWDKESIVDPPTDTQTRIVLEEQTIAVTQPTENAISIATQEKAQYALERIDNAIVIKDKIRAHLGALQNRLENTITNINTQAENLQAAESRISDVDVATEMTEFVRQQILAQSAVAMLSQANSMPQMAMQIIGG
jgi:flagellin